MCLLSMIKVNKCSYKNRYGFFIAQEIAVASIDVSITLFSFSQYTRVEAIVLAHHMRYHTQSIWTSISFKVKRRFQVKRNQYRSTC